MDTLCKKLLLLICAVVLGSSLNAQENVSKTITKEFDLTNKGELHLVNKYGNIAINGWSKNSLSVSVKVTVTHKKKEYAENLLSRIDAVDNELNDLISITSVISDKSTGFFAKYFSKVNPFDFDRSNVQIDYTIYLPRNAEIDITNVFGDLVIEDWTGKLKGEIQHGDVWINEDLNTTDLDLKYGKLRAKSINYGTIRLKNGSLDMNSAKDLRINSSGSNIAIDKVASLEVYSSKDVIQIEALGSVYGELKFSEMQLQEVNGAIKMTMRIADFKVSHLTNIAPVIDLKQESSEISLNIADLDFNFKATLEQGLLRIPKSFKNVNTKMIDKGKRIREISATYGSKGSGSIVITGKKGVVLLKELK